MPSLQVVEHRRALHRIPELDDRLPETAAYVGRVLSELPCRLYSPIRGSFCAWFDAGKQETAAFRADMDALPIEEATGLPYASVHPGVMHACGHDGHTAMALALAGYAAEHLTELPRNVLLIFQPSEETTGGAKAICETGILQKYRVRRVFGLHLWPGLPEGTVWARPGPQMARSSEVTVSFTGKSAHVSKYQEGVDALTAGAEYLLRAYSMMAQLPPEEPALLRFGKLTSGAARNVVSGQTRLEGTLRTYSDRRFRFCQRQLRDIGRSVAMASGCAVTAVFSEGYPAVWNHDGLYQRVLEGLGAQSPSLLSQPVLAAEDFSFYQQEVPGVFFFLGTGDTPPLHAADFSFNDEAVLPKGVEFLQKLLYLI